MVARKRVTQVCCAACGARRIRSNFRLLFELFSKIDTGLTCILQESFDEAVQENITEFDMTVTASSHY
jgi:hypothetical protein